MVMLMTGYAEITSDEARQKGAEALFSKPFNRLALVEAVIRFVLTQKIASAWQGSKYVDLPIEVMFNDAPRLAARVISLSKKEIFVQIHDNFPQVNDRVVFNLFLESPQPWLSTTGVVKWLRFKSLEGAPAGVGIEFYSLSEDQKIELDGYFS